MAQENVCVESVGYLLEELRNPETLANFKKVCARLHRTQLHVPVHKYVFSTF